LNGYALFIDKVRNKIKKGNNLSNAIQTAMGECLAEGVLVEELLKYQ